MVMKAGYSSAVMAAAVAQMAGSYRTRTRLHLLDLDHHFIADLSGLRISDGAVTVSADQPISRSMSIQLVDRTDMLGLSAQSSTPAFLMQAWKGIYVDSLAQWVDLPVICAYVSKPSRIGDLLTIEGQDKGALGSFPTSSLTIKKGRNVGSAIREIMHDRAGETRFRLAKTSKTLRRDYVLDDQTTPWALAQSLAESIGWKLFYDGEGYCTGRTPSAGVVFTFRSGIGGTLATGVQSGYWDGDLFNRVLVDGPVVSGKKVSATAVLPASHKLSPQNLLRGGVLASGLRTFRYESKTLKTRSDAGEWAEAKLRALAIQQQTASFSSVPVWHLQEHDVIRAIDPIDGVDVTARWTQGSIPMTCEGLQSNGFTKPQRTAFNARVTTRSRRVKTKAKKKR